MRTAMASVLLATALSGACHTMRPMTLDELSNVRTARAWVTRPDQSVVVMDGPRVFRGKLVGFIDGKYKELPPTDLQRIMVRQIARGRTASLIAGGTVGFLVAVVLLAGHEPTFDPCVGGSADCEPSVP